MAQSWLRTYPLRWLDRSLKFAIAPFTNAKDIGIYATRGYFLLGMLSAAPVLACWARGFLPTIFAQFPEGMRDRIVFAFGLIGVENVSWIIPLTLLVMYAAGFAVKPVRHAVGELTAKAFFGTIDFGISIGEWCLQHRWSSLFIVIALACSISWGIYALFEIDRIKQEEATRTEIMTIDFNTWLSQADTFLERNPFTGEESEPYKRSVETLWKTEFATGIKLGDGRPHPAIVLHKMLHEVFHDKPSPGSDEWRKFLMSKLDTLKRYMQEYEFRDGEKTVEEKKAWALMNIFMGRVYFRLAEFDDNYPEELNKTHTPKSSFLLISRGYFSKIGEGYEQRHQAAARNGLGNIYSNVLEPSRNDPTAFSEGVRLVCGPAGRPEECVKLALEKYAKETPAKDPKDKDNPCTYEKRRRANNMVLLLARVGLNYSQMNPGSLKFNEGCDSKTKVGLADCIERQIVELMSCTGRDPFIGITFTTTAQGYGASAELRRGEQSAPEVEARAAAAGKYLRLAYSLRSGPQTNMDEMKAWGLCYFRFTADDKALEAVFWKAIGIEPALAPASECTRSRHPFPTLEPLPAPAANELCKTLQNKVAKCSQTR